MQRRLTGKSDALLDISSEVVEAARHTEPTSKEKVEHAARRHLIDPATLLRVLLTCIALLIAAEILRQVALHGFGHGNIYGLAPLVKLDAERNIPTWFSTVQLFLASILAFTIFLDLRLDGSPWTAHWVGLGLIMLYISLDEAIKLHEKTIDPVKEALGLGGFLSFAWVVLATPAVVIFALAYIGFLRSLPKRTAGLIFLAGAIYVVGALGLEMVGAAIGNYDLTYDVVAATEESLELIGIALFVFALSEYASRHCRRIGPLFGRR